MNKTALKNFATWSRRKLIEQVQTKARLYGIDEKNGLHIEEQFGQLLINGQTYPLSIKPAFTSLQKQLEQKGYKQLLEEAAYTWFNRIIAIRYMEVHEYLSEQVNVLSSSIGRADPDILFEYDTMDLNIKVEEIRELVNAGNTEEAYRILFVAQCNALNRILPFMFEPIQDYTELLLPDFLLDAESVIKTLVQNRELTESFAEIEVIGWLYQYYIAEEKDRVFAQKSKYKKEEIPFATQLFTPKWIVQYMVQNSLGLYWTEAHREDEDLIDNWDYFIKHEEEDFHEKIVPYVNKELKVEDIKLLDPAMGSGHILVYAFEVFHEIYEKCGYPERDIPRLILENNLYGLDIDDRAYQLAAFAVVMKAAQSSRRFLRSVEREGIQLNLASIQETNHISDDVVAYIAQQEDGERYDRVKAFFNQYHNAKTYGSLINITEREIAFIEERFEHIINNPVKDLFYVEQHDLAKKVLPALIHQTKIMRKEYDIVILNPPYLSNSKMNNEMSKFSKLNYSLSKNDLFSMFIEKSLEFTKLNGLNATINQQVWMFTSRYKKVRTKILKNTSIMSMVYLGSNAFEEINGEVVQSTAYVLLKGNISDFKGVYFKLNKFSDSESKRIALLNSENKFYKNQKFFDNIPDFPLAFWATEKTAKLFKNEMSIVNFAEPKVGLQTGENEKFIRYWYEVNSNDISFPGEYNIENKNTKKWFSYNKGGTFRKWYGNNDLVVNWRDNGRDIKADKHQKLLEGKIEKKNSGCWNENYYFKRGITWSTLTTKDISFRYSEEGNLFDNKGSMIFFEEEDIQFFIMGYLNSSVANLFLSYLSPTLDYSPGTVANLPYKHDFSKKIVELVKEAIEVVKEDWLTHETSPGYKIANLIKYDVNLCSEAYNIWLRECESRKSKLIDIEKGIDEYFIDLYDVREEVHEFLIENGSLDSYLRESTEEVLSKELISYFIGTIFGRFQGSQIKSNRNIISLLDSNELIAYFKKFLCEEFGENELTENFEWVMSHISVNGSTVEEKFVNYIFNNFYKDHSTLYNNLPIYWLVDSGKQKGLRTLIYMHRYQPDTMATIRFDHLQEIQAKYQQEIADLENRLVNPNLSATDKKKLNTEKVSFEKKIEELREFDKRLAVIAAEEIEIDLDVGVKVNYDEFYRGGKGVLAKIK
ncbi:BREX-1 system adenine-specific DNA-methyltransferase PglX [Lysinibacillus fusiformis]|uniref:BREX-1 system adenine-specific DNA-methyltransferase PglX n=1 Tax=Lysinibacillus sp. PWR01 TaxID=3342384 RepID=UPI00372CF3A6